MKCNFSDVYICITLNWSDRPEDIDTMKEDTQRSESFQNKREDKYVLFVSTSHVDKRSLTLGGENGLTLGAENALTWG